MKKRSALKYLSFLFFVLSVLCLGYICYEGLRFYQFKSTSFSYPVDISKENLEYRYNYRHLIPGKYEIILYLNVRSNIPEESYHYETFTWIIAIKLSHQNRNIIDYKIDKTNIKGAVFVRKGKQHPGIILESYHNGLFDLENYILYIKTLVGDKKMAKVGCCIEIYPVWEEHPALAVVVTTFMFLVFLLIGSVLRRKNK